MIEILPPQEWSPAQVAAGAAIAGACAAWVAAVNGSRTLRRARKDSQERSRPMVAAELRSERYTKGVQVLVIKNYGPTIARNVKVTFDPPIPDPSPEEAGSSVTPYLKRRYEKPIPVLTPGMELDNLWFVARGPGMDNSEPTPDRCNVTIEYDDAGCTKTYKDSFVIDVDVIRKRTYTTSSAAPPSQMKEGVKALKSIAESLKGRR